MLAVAGVVGDPAVLDDEATEGPFPDRDGFGGVGGDGHEDRGHASPAGAGEEGTQAGPVGTEAVTDDGFGQLLRSDGGHVDHGTETL